MDKPSEGKKETKIGYKRIRPLLIILLLFLFIIGPMTLWRQSNTAKGYFMAGEFFYKMKWYDMAEEAYHKAVELDIYYPKVHYKRGLVLHEMGFYGDAINEYKKELDLVPVYTDTNDNFALIYAGMGEAYYMNGASLASSGDETGSITMYNEALIACNKALSLNANFIPAYSLLGKLHHTSGMLDEAVKDYSKILELSNDEGALVEGYYRLGIIYASRGDNKMAIRHLKKALEINPYFPPALYEIGKIYHKEEALDSAINVWRKAVHYEPDFIEVHYELANVYVRQGWYKDAQREYLATIRLCEKINNKRVIPLLSGAYANLGTLYYYENGEKDKGINCWKKAVEIDSSNEMAKENIKKVSKSNGAEREKI